MSREVKHVGSLELHSDSGLDRVARLSVDLRRDRGAASALYLSTAGGLPCLYTEGRWQVRYLTALSRPPNVVPSFVTS